MKRATFLLFLGSVMASPIVAQKPAVPLVAQAIDETQVVRLHGSVHPLAQPRYDRGAVPDAFPAERVLLLLNRPAERESALQEFLGEVHRRESTSHHQWLTPQEFGERFGPADSDIQAVANWLREQGFNVAKVTKSKQFLEFSGTAAQLRQALHTEIHQYDVEGETHYANASELSIPEALAPLVRGISPLHDFRAKPYIQLTGRALYSRANNKAMPLWTFPTPGAANPDFFLLAPEDFAAQYDLGPLYAAGLDGTGQTIGIINESNVDVSLVSAYQQLFGLPNNPTQVVIDGQDPGTLAGPDVEAYLDVEVSGSVAPKATVNLYISDGGNLQDPVSLAAIRAVEDNQASVLSVSFGNCEPFLGNAGNQFWAALWEQAAAQGQTVLVASGDAGPLCFFGYSSPTVSGIASTPWNVAVGGTDFYYSDYATGGASAGSLWNQTNDSNLGSLKAPLPEQVWNDAYGLDVIPHAEPFAAGGGTSNCSTITTTGTSSTCASGYAKPNWQSGPGVPADSVRDLPDVSLFASSGADLSAYPICAFAGECAAGAGAQALIEVAGGTSASTPAMAGIMALVNQKYGRQGQANFTLYPLAQQKPAAFHDVTLGSNSVPCSQGTTDCVQNASGHYATTVYSAGPGYDLASGLGSVDANVLVNNWSSITFKPTTTSLQLSSANITHGMPVTVSTSVAASSGTGTPTGGVAILTDSPLPSNQSQTVLNLSAGTTSSTINYFPGGYYNVSAKYDGDGVFGSSTSPPVALKVSPENSTVTLSLSIGGKTIAAGGSVEYNYPFPLTLSIQPIGVSSITGKPNGVATGMATFTIDAVGATVPLNSSGMAIWRAPALSVGTHTASATYSGDASFNASSAAPVTFSVTQGIPFMDDSIEAPSRNIDVGGSLTVSIVVEPNNGPFFGNYVPVGTAAPTGTVTACLQPLNASDVCLNPSYTQTATLTPPSGINSLSSSATFILSNLAAGFYYLTFSYSGDTNWQKHGLIDLGSFVVAPITPLAATTTTLSITPASISNGQFATISTTVTSSGTPSGAAPTGAVDFYDNRVFLAYILLPLGKTGSTASGTFSFPASAFWGSGANQITAIYGGDSNYAPSTSSVVNISVTQRVGDFALAPQLSQITFAPGGSGTVGLNLTSLNTFSGVVSLSCATSSSNISCDVSPSVPMVSGTATARLTVTSSSAPAAAGRVQTTSQIVWLGPVCGVFFACVLMVASANRKRHRFGILASFSLLAVMCLTAGCGGGGQIVQPPPPPPVGTAYSVVVTGTANGIVHNAKITVIVR